MTLEPIALAIVFLALFALAALDRWFSGHAARETIRELGKIVERQAAAVDALLARQGVTVPGEPRPPLHSESVRPGGYVERSDGRVLDRSGAEVDVDQFVAKHYPDVAKMIRSGRG